MRRFIAIIFGAWLLVSVWQPAIAKTKVVTCEFAGEATIRDGTLDTVKITDLECS